MSSQQGQFEVDAVYVDKDVRQLFDALSSFLREYSSELAEGLEHKDALLLAASIGYRQGHRLALRAKDQIIKTKSLDPPDLCLICAMSLGDGPGEDSQLSMKAAYATFEEYANAGIRLMADHLKDPDVFGDWLRVETLSAAKQLPKSDAHMHTTD